MIYLYRQALCLPEFQNSANFKASRIHAGSAFEKFRPLFVSTGNIDGLTSTLAALLVLTVKITNPKSLGPQLLSR